jgi:NAD(P)H dehydrogenase (quinone)
MLPDALARSPAFVALFDRKGAIASMRCLVVKAHPLSESLCSLVTRRVVELLQTAGHEVTLEDLYAEKFDAVMTPEERASYYEKPYSSQSFDAQIERLLSAEAIVLVFPTWWFSFPAILKGWFDRVWGPGLAYDHATDYGPIKPRLHGLREMLAITSLGAPKWVDWIIMRQPVKKVLKTAIVGTCAPGCRFRMVSVYKSESLTKAQVDEFWSRVERALSRW